MLDIVTSSNFAANLDSQSGTLFLLLINSLFASQCSLNDKNLYPPDSGSKIQDEDHFDFIVVGAGSAGSVVASEIINNGKWKVLILEAGGYPSMTTEIPLLFFNIQFTDQIWGYQTEPSKQYCLGLTNGSSHWPRAKLLGGCSSINAMLYIRGNRNDYDSWSNAGNPGWDYDNVMKAFKENEKLLAEDLKHFDTYGRDGLLSLTKYKFNETIRDVILKSVEELGYPILESEGPLGFFESLQMIKEGTRANAAKEFLGSVSRSDKITLATNAHVERILIEENQEEAQGVQVKIGNRTMKLYADKEVILSAGSLNSPQILLLSGVGPTEHLEKHGIKVIKDLKVGYNLQDHLTYWFFSKIGDEALRPTVLEDELYKYFAHRQGEFSNIGVTNINGFINTRNNSRYPDIQFTYISIKKNDLNSLNTLMQQINMDPTVAENLRRTNIKNHLLCTVVILLQPKSRGRVLLRSNDPFDHPILRAGYLTDEAGEDIETMVRGIRFAEAQIESEAFKRLNAEILDIDIPNCRKLGFASDEYYRCALRNLATTLYHQSGTCKMGPASDKTAVVDSRLRVHGISKLRVVDAGIMPTIISGNTNAPSMMIGRKAAHMIIEDHSNVKN